MTEATFLHGDCLEVLPTLPKGSVDMVFCDLPYGITSAHWDNLIDLTSLWSSFEHCGNAMCNYVFTAVQPFATELICSNKRYFRHETIWQRHQSRGFQSANKRPMRAHENVLLFCSAGGKFNPQKTRCKKTAHTKGKPYSGLYGKNIEQIAKVYEKKYPTSIIYFNEAELRHDTLGGHKPQRLHPTQKPIGLLRYLIRTYSNPGDTILDPTAGSMTTGVAALLERRNVILIEKDPIIFANAKERVMAVQRSLIPREAKG